MKHRLQWSVEATQWSHLSWACWSEKLQAHEADIIARMINWRKKFSSIKQQLENTSHCCQNKDHILLVAHKALWPGPSPPLSFICHILLLVLSCFFRTFEQDDISG